jgi:tRNA-specific 2-thiouridylase
MSQKVYVGMSGGVDSSVTAALLQKQGYDVTGVYMKNWSQDLPGFTCPWKEDYQDAKRVAVQLGIPFKMYDFETQYRQKVVDYLVSGYQSGITPNPDIMCNQEIKFKLFLETALEDGADAIATGHYARVHDGKLLVGTDSNKDQSYFLYRVTEQALKKSLMPIGEYEKPAVRELARGLGLSTAEKKDSQGICFVGKVGIKEFLIAELGPQAPGAIIDQTNHTVGEHDGALFYTIGQRHGLSVGGGLPYYVVGKDMAKNEVFVSTDLADARLWSKQLSLTNMHWINGEEAVQSVDPRLLTVRTRYRAALESCELTIDDQTAELNLNHEIRAITPGQSAVIYSNDLVLGGGIVI